MRYFEISGGVTTYDQIILDPEDWPEEHWKAFLDLFGLKEAEQIAFLNYRVGVYGTKKGNVEGGD